MRRPEEHITDSAGERQLRTIFEPLGWTVNKLEHDYGIDFLVEVFCDYQSTGVSFKVQLKSSTASRYSADGEFISQPIELPNAKYLCRELRSPVILIHADVTSGRTFWAAPQLLAGEIQTALDANSSNVTLRVSTRNELPATLDELIEVVGQVEQVLASRLFIETPSTAFLKATGEGVDQERLIRSFQDKSDAIKLEQASNLFDAGQPAKARARAQKVIVNDESSVASKFAGILLTERIDFVQAIRISSPQGVCLRLHLDTTSRLRELTRKGPPHLKFYALIARKAAELEALVLQDYGLFMNWNMHEEGGDKLWRLQLIFERMRAYRRVVFKYNQCMRLVNYAINYRHRFVLPQALLRIVNSISSFISRLSQEGWGELPDRYSASALEVCRIAAEIAEAHGDELTLSLAATTAPMTKYSETGEAIDWAREAISRIKDEEIKSRAVVRLEDQIKAIAGEKTKFYIETTDQQIYENMARGLGIDTSDETDPNARLVRAGIADLDPSRVLKNCEHLFICLASQSTVSRLLRLQTANHKIILCDLHSYGVRGLALDEAYERFKREYCDKCPDCSPRSPTWRYSGEWQEEENARHRGFLKEFANRVGGEYKRK
jgi:hypothetical protein